MMARTKHSLSLADIERDPGHARKIYFVFAILQPDPIAAHSRLRGAIRPQSQRIGQVLYVLKIFMATAKSQ